MCGIIGYRGSRPLGSMLAEGLKCLEYRGYDSVGAAVLKNGTITIAKDKGRIEDVAARLHFADLTGEVGIAHSRWATHGPPSKENAHPHQDCTAAIALVHNGIVENVDALRKQVKSHTFRSETDSEVVAHLIEERLSLGLERAVREVFALLKGRNAIVVLGKDGKIVAVRRGSPLIVGVGDNELFIASDIPAFLPYTKDVMYLDDNEVVVIDRDVKFFSMTGAEVQKRRVHMDIDARQAEKGEYPHYLIKEIMEQKDTIRRAINQDDDEILAIAEKINSAFGTIFTGCGTAGKVCLAAEYIFSKVANKHVNVIVSSEFPHSEHFLTPKTLVIAVSQSGETADVLDALDAAKRKGAQIISLVNVASSSVARMSDQSLLINAGPEKAVASTKATTAQLSLLTLIAYACAGQLKEGKRLLTEVAGEVNDLLNPRYEQRIQKLAQQISSSQNMVIIGRGVNYPMALESAIKIMEVSQIHAQGFAGGELKHGPLALISAGTPCIVLVNGDKEILSNAREVKARSGFIIGVSSQKHELFDEWIKVPDVGIASPIVNIIPIQMLAYYLGIARGVDPDYSRNLAKSVTVR